MPGWVGPIRHTHRSSERAAAHDQEINGNVTKHLLSAQVIPTSHAGRNIPASQPSRSHAIIGLEPLHIRTRAACPIGQRHHAASTCTIKYNRCRAKRSEQTSSRVRPDLFTCFKPRVLFFEFSIAHGSSYVKHFAQRCPLTAL